MKLASIAITSALIASVTGCGGSSETSRDDAIAELLASAAADGVNNEDFVAQVADAIYEVLEQNHGQTSLTRLKTTPLAKKPA